MGIFEQRTVASRAPLAMPEEAIIREGEGRGSFRMENKLIRVEKILGPQLAEPG